MAMSGGEAQRSSHAVTIGRHRYLRAPVPVHFPEHEQVPETKWHLELRTLLYQFLTLAFAERAHIGCDQFVYFDAANPRVCLSPDAFVRFGAPDELFGSWKVWERGAPHAAVEVISDFDGRDKNWDAKLASYRQLGVDELVRFDPDAAVDKLRIWDRVDGDLLERALGASTAPVPSNVLPGYWLVVFDPRLGPTLRLSRDEQGRDLYLTPAEAEARARQAEAQARRAEAQAREAAEARVKDLEEQLRRLQAPGSRR